MNTSSQDGGALALDANGQQEGKGGHQVTKRQKLNTSNDFVEISHQMLSGVQVGDLPSTASSVVYEPEVSHHDAGVAISSATSDNVGRTMSSSVFAAAADIAPIQGGRHPRSEAMPSSTQPTEMSAMQEEQMYRMQHPVGATGLGQTHHVVDTELLHQYQGLTARNSPLHMMGGNVGVVLTGSTVPEQPGGHGGMQPVQQFFQQPGALQSFVTPPLTFPSGFLPLPHIPIGGGILPPHQGSSAGTATSRFVPPPAPVAESTFHVGPLLSLQGAKPASIVQSAATNIFVGNIDPNAASNFGSGGRVTGRRPLTLFMPCDEDSLSEYQCLVRKQIEIFEAGPGEVESNAKGRNKPIVLGQVGIRCRHCSHLPPKQRERGAMYYPAKLNGLYQAAQSMASGHLCFHCKHIQPGIRQELLVLRERKSSAGGGKKYWGDGVRVLSVYEDKSGLRFRKKDAAATT